MSLPNTLTISRIVMTFVFIIMVVQDGFYFKLAALFLFCFASITDFFDGYLARKNNEITNFGKIMDPLADKFLMITAFLILVSLDMMSVWFFVLIFIREVLITAIRWYAQSQGEVLAAENMGKAKTVTQVWAIFIVLLFLVFQETVWGQGWADVTLGRWHMLMDTSLLIAVVLTLVSGGTFIYNNGGLFIEDTSH